MAWKEKHNFILNNKVDIVKKYEEDISIKEIAGIYKVTPHCIWNNLKSWGLLKEHGIKSLLRKMILEG